MTKFYISEKEQVMTSNGKMATQIIRTEISKKKALNLSDRLLKELGELEATFPEVQKSFNLLDAKCIEKAKFFNDCLTAKSPRFREAKEALGEVVKNRDTILNKYQDPRKELLKQIEELARPLIDEKTGEWYSRRTKLPEKIRISGGEEIRSLVGSTFEVVTNEKIVREAMNYLQECESKLRSMTLKSLNEIFNFIDEVEVGFSKFDLEVSTVENLNGELFKYLRDITQEQKVSVDLETAYHNPSGTGFTVIKKFKGGI